MAQFLHTQSDNPSPQTGEAVYLRHPRMRPSPLFILTFYVFARLDRESVLPPRRDAVANKRTGRLQSFQSPQVILGGSRANVSVSLLLCCSPCTNLIGETAI